jgi:hypothetical protein
MASESMCIIAATNPPERDGSPDFNESAGIIESLDAFSLGKKILGLVVFSVPNSIDVKASTMEMISQESSSELSKYPKVLLSPS